MKNFQRTVMASFLLLAIACAAPALAKDDDKASAKEKSSSELVVRPWERRCVDLPAKDKTAEAPKKSCAIFERVEIKDTKKKTSMRLSEFVVGYSDSKDKNGAALAKVIMPLGILLDSGVVMNVDGDKKVTFKPRYCTSDEGCVSIAEVSKDVLDSMTKGKALSFLFKTMDGRDGKLDMSLNGFGAALKGLQ